MDASVYFNLLSDIKEIVKHKTLFIDFLYKAYKVNFELF